MSKGQRQIQEDVLHLWFSPDAKTGYIVVADGMGGHTSGDVASNLAVQTVDNLIKPLLENPAELEKDIKSKLSSIIEAANDTIYHHSRRDLETLGMGTTLLIALFIEGRLYWASVGDSPLFIMRKNDLTRLNEDHSMAQHIDQMVLEGLLSEEDARNHPDRSALVSVLMGEPIPDMDCTSHPLELEKGDIVIASSDGIQSLSEIELSNTLNKSNQTTDQKLASITSAIDACKNPYQDNLALCIAEVL
jgi:serine/threonine protein phosphatase PrpC